MSQRLEILPIPQSIINRLVRLLNTGHWSVVRAFRTLGVSITDFGLDPESAHQLVSEIYQPDVLLEVIDMLSLWYDCDVDVVGNGRVQRYIDHWIDLATR